MAMPIPGNDDIRNATDLLLSVSICSLENKAKIFNLAFAASEELQQMALEKEPLWLIDRDKETEILNNADYQRRFACLDSTLQEVIRVITTGDSLLELSELEKYPQARGEKDDFLSMEAQASRAVGLVSASPLSLVNVFTDVEQWSSVFPNIVSSTSILGSLSTGNQGSPHGALQVVTAELHVPSPLVSTCVICFTRYCRQFDPNTWMVVDVSLESIFPNLALRCQRRPSGCLIQGLDEGSSKVTWVENSVVNVGSANDMFRHLVVSGLAFGAKRWIATLERHCDRNSRFSTLDQIASPKDKKGLGAGKKSLLALAERMVRSFNVNLSSYSENPWRPIPIKGSEDILVKTSFNQDHPGAPPGVAVTIATSVRLQKPPKDVFHFLGDVQNRYKWDLLSCGRVAREIENISFGRDSANRVSIFSTMPETKRRTKKKKANKKLEMVYVQETFNDSTGMYVVYAPIEKAAMHYIMDGKDPESVCILPCGFAVLPEAETGGSILTIAFEIIDETLSTPEQLPSQSFLTANSIVKATVDMIRAEIAII